MEEGMKKTVMLGVVIACLAIAGVVTYSRYSGGEGGIDSIAEEDMIWVKCNNPACKAEYQVGMKGYFQYIQENVNPLAQTTPALVCEKCGEHSVYRAEKCPNCGLIFLRNSVPGDHPDRCPKCKYSETEESRKRRRAERGK
jgi:predicted Zn-ribbon and HTH transcriptional regulator